MKIVYDNIIFSLQKAGGISIYWTELIKRFKNKGEILFYEKKNNNIFRKLIFYDVKNESTLGFKILRYLPFIKKLPEKSIFHSSYYRISLQKDIANINTVHDFTYEYFRTGMAKYIHIWQKGFAIKKSDGIICVSENTRRDLMKFYPMIEDSKVKVIYNGVGNEFIKLENSKEFLIGQFEILKNKKYILYVGDRGTYKNFNIAVEVLKQLDDYMLVIVGGQKLSSFENELIEPIKNRTCHFRGISSEKLNILYNNAFCLLYPSSYEGFGIPVSEAMKSGCPVVSTNTSSIPEVAGQAALLVDDIKVNSFIPNIKHLENKKLRGELIYKGLEQSKKFSWDKCFSETYDFYETIWKKIN
jgi:glycosyltransferase involved in cell wall biosynthesis